MLDAEERRALSSDVYAVGVLADGVLRPVIEQSFAASTMPAAAVRLTA